MYSNLHLHQTSKPPFPKKYLHVYAIVNNLYVYAIVNNLYVYATISNQEVCAIIIILQPGSVTHEQNIAYLLSVPICCI